MKFFLLFILLTAFIFQNSFCQDKTIDSLKNIIQTEKEDTDKVNNLNQLSHKLFGKGDYKNCLQYAKNALSLSEKLFFIKGKAEAYLNIGSFYDDQGDYPEALRNAYTSLNYSLKSSNQKCIASAFQLIGGIYYYQDNDSESLKFFIASREIREKMKDTLGLAQSFNSLGEIYLKNADYNKAIANFLIALNIYQSKGNEAPLWGVAWSYSVIGKVYMEKGDSFLNTGNKTVAFVYYREACKNYFKGLKSWQKTGKKVNIGQLYCQLGYISLKFNRLSRAKYYFQKSLSLSVDDKLSTMSEYESLSGLDSMQENYKEAYKHYKMYILYRDSIYNEENTKKSLQVQMQYEFDKKEDSIKAAQDKKNLLSKTEIENQKNIRNFSYATTLAVFGFAGIGFYRFRRRKKLQSYQEMLNERLRISRELHDDIGSTLGSISIYSEVAKSRAEKKENPDEVLAKIGNTSRDLIDKMSDIVWSLNPGNESFEQLQNRMSAFAAMILAPRDIWYEVTQNEEIKKMKLSAEQRKNIFLIFKEAIYNIAKYADCKKVNIILNIENGIFKMTIDDDGKGFNIAENNSYNGNGIKNMMARADEIKATFKIISDTGTGTSVELIAPL